MVRCDAIFLFRVSGEESNRNRWVFNTVKLSQAASDQNKDVNRQPWKAATVLHGMRMAADARGGRRQAKDFGNDKDVAMTSGEQREMFHLIIRKTRRNLSQTFLLATLVSGY